MVTKGEETKAHIIQVSAEVFNRFGYTATSMSDLMAATGLKKGGIYRHFESKDDLALQAFDYAIELVDRYYARALVGKHHAIDRLTAIAEAFDQSHFGTQQGYAPIKGGCVIMNTAVESDETYPQLKERAQAALIRWEDTVKRIVQSGIRREELHPDVDPAEVAATLIGTLEGALLMSRLHDDDPFYMTLAKQHLQTYFTSLTP